MIGARERIYRRRDRLKQLRAFCRTARLGSFTRAADDLLVDPSVVSLQVREVERELGIDLFERSGPHISLTSAGERFYRLALPLVEGMDGLPDAFARQLVLPVRDIRLSAGAIGAIFVLPRLVKRFRDAHPGVAVRVRSGPLEEILALVRAGEVELAFGTANTGAQDLRYRPIFLYETVLITPEGHPLAGRGSVSVAEAAAGPVVMPDPNLYGGQYGHAIRQWFGGTRAAVVEASDWTALKRCVEQGIGAGILPDVCLEGGERVGVVRLRELTDRQSYGLYTRRDAPLSPAAATMVRIIESEPLPGASRADGSSGPREARARQPRGPAWTPAASVSRREHASEHLPGGAGGFRRDREARPLDAGKTGMAPIGASPDAGRPAMVPDPRPVPGRHDRLKQLRAFCHAAQLRSISRAAERIHSSQPVVSRQIGTLEKELGTALFERPGPYIALTPAGAMLHRLARPLVEGMDRLSEGFVERHHGSPSGPLLIGAGQSTAAFALPEYLDRFRRRHPGTPVHVRTGRGQERLAWLRDYQMDLVMVSVEVPPPDLEFHELFTSEHVYITPLHHPLAGRESVEVEEAASFPAVAPRSGTYLRHLMEMLMRLHGVAAPVVTEADGWNAIKTCVAAGLGVAVVPALCLHERDRVWRIPFGRNLPPRRYGLLTRRDGLLSLSARRFMRAAGVRLAAADPLSAGTLNAGTLDGERPDRGAEGP